MGIFEDISGDIQALHDSALAKGCKIATAESCTGGLLGAALTQMPGSSAYYQGGIIAYDNSAKEDLLGVSSELLHTYGAVSREVALSMAAGALGRLNVDVAVSVTGIAGPSGGTANKPVGTVWLGIKGNTWEDAVCLSLAGGREAVRLQTVREGLKLMKSMIEKKV